MGNLTFTEAGWEEYTGWQTTDKTVLRKINDILKDIQRNGPSDGIGKPELLKYRKAWSRRIDKKNRLVYTVDDEGTVLILSCEGHYDD